jgi:nicotinamidase/pyrazinamidase
MKKALIIVDVQKDFCPGGALAVPEGDKVVPVINKLSKEGNYKRIVATRDWHPEKHCSFKDQGGPWPVHCIGDNQATGFHEDLYLGKVDIILHKGREIDTDSYSAFIENDGKTITGLHSYLSIHDIKIIDVCGLAFDYCVWCTAKDGITLGYKVNVIKEATRAVNLPEGNEQEVTDQMKKIGINII